MFITRTQVDPKSDQYCWTFDWKKQNRDTENKARGLRKKMRQVISTYAKSNEPSRLRFLSRYFLVKLSESLKTKP